MKIKIFAVIFLLSFVVASVQAQVTEAEKNLRTQTTDTIEGWKKGGMFNVNLAQTSLTNWAAGGEPSVAVNGIFSVFANLKRGKSTWDNSLDLGYGFLTQGEKGKKETRKTDDKIDLVSKYGRQAYKNLYYAALMNFRTQMAPGWNYSADPKVKISDLFAPAYLLTALGLDYKPNANFSAFFAPLTAKFTFVTDELLSDAGAFGVTPGEKSKSELGGYLRAIYSKNDFQGEFMKNISFTTKFDLFSNYADNPQNIDVMWETLIGMKVNKYIGVSLNTVLIYDDNIKVPFDRNDNGTVEAGESVGSKVQFKEIFGVGFSYKF
ncbi:MAG TPA: DUF3078 domain-containing protein [Bacteroidales bacterium]|nr:DUF3078 domain-containing protein [Bacteroidales bacterium]HPJ59931.1 DUF3078 domain-containing protein [Bacteroidales bacterium]HPR12319.1 DUF3078 domain-containing protein [Bacteroidales bacterium]